MLKHKLAHPEILAALGSAGHGSQILIADGNYPFSTGSNSEARHVFLNLTRGFAPADEVLSVLVDAVPVEAAHVMMPDKGPEPPIFGQFRRILTDSVPLQTYGRFEFYDAARDKNVALVIATGEQRVYANLLLTIGVVPED